MENTSQIVPGMSNRDIMISDGGATACVVNRKDWLQDFEPYEAFCSTADDGQKILITGKGKLVCSLFYDGVPHHMEIENVFYSPNFGYNLFPVLLLDLEGYEISYGDRKVKIKKNGKPVGSGFLTPSRLYVIDCQVSKSESVSTAALKLNNVSPKLSALDLHCKFGHKGFKTFEKMHRDGHFEDIAVAENAFKNKNLSWRDCPDCLQTKMTRQSFRASNVTKLRSNRLLGLLHMDLITDIKPQSIHHEKYILTVVDDFSGCIWTIPLKSKNETFSAFQQLHTRICLETNERVNTIRSDRGGEFISNEFKEWCLSQGILLDLVPRKTPQLNGVAERANRTVVEGTKVLLHSSKISGNLWPYALRAFTHVHNRCQSNGRNYAGQTKQSPYEVYYGSSPPLERIHRFGCAVTYYVPKASRLSQIKFGKVTEDGYFIGYKPSSYSILTADRRKIIDVPIGEVEFYENQVPMSSSDKCNQPSFGCEQMEQSLSEDMSDDCLESESGVVQTRRQQAPTLGRKVQTRSNTRSSLARTTLPIQTRTLQPSEQESEQVQSVQQTELLSVTSDSESVKSNVCSDSESSHSADEADEEWPLPESLAELHSLLLNLLINDKVKEFDKYVLLVDPLIPSTPKSVEEARKSKQWPQWKESLLSELRSLIKNETWEVVGELPVGRKLLPCKWVFKIKLNSDGSLERYKSRLVVKGFKQVSGVDYNETFAPVAKISTIRLLMAIAAKYDLEIKQMDFSTAFLNGDLDEEIYMAGPSHTEFECKILKLKKSMYGLKQAPRCWNNKIDQFLRINLGFTRCSADNCVYVKGEGEKLFIIALYVDDIMFITKDQQQLCEVQNLLQEAFDMRDLGDLEFIVGIRVRRDRVNKTITLDQTAYCDRILKKFDMDKSTPVSLPMVERPEFDVDFEQPDVYRSVVGSLMYLLVATRPDIAFAVSELSRAVSRPSQRHWQAAKRVLRYLRGTIDMGLVYNGHNDLTPFVYVDADYANDKDTRRSQTGYALLMAGAAVSWKSKLQPKVSLSSTEAEYYACTFASQEVAWVRELLKEIGFDFSNEQVELLGYPSLVDITQTNPKEKATVMLEDNQACIALSKNPESFSRTKHIEVRFHFIREMVERGIIKLVYCKTGAQAADILTKPMTVAKAFVQHVCRFGLKSS
ncbi:hypothetical protein MIR68_000560 [Amoeboaphelidium protococcarum]|nr:hypothetical protein MIR68_000560 [Amoeboaphelidium protococcarum]